jgi:hypothetical protein
LRTTARTKNRHKKLGSAVARPYLGEERLLVAAERVVVEAEGVVGAAQRVVVALQLLGLPARAPVLEPHGDLAGLQAEVARQPLLVLRIQPGVLLEAPLQRAHLLPVQPALLLPCAAAVHRGVLVQILFHPHATKIIFFKNKHHITSDQTS